MFTFNGSVMNSTDLQRQVDEFRRNSETPVLGAEPDFGQRLKEATQRRAAQHQRTRIEATASTSTDESFGKKIKRAVAARLPRAQTQKQHAEQAERERNRYHKPVRRQRSKSDG